MSKVRTPVLLVLNQMAGPMTWELVEDCAARLGPVALLTGHPDTLAKPGSESILVFAAMPYHRGTNLRRALSWVRYLWQAFWWARRWPAETPLLVFSNPPLAPWLAYLLKKLRDQRYSVMIHDIYPDLLVELGKLSSGHPLVRLWHRLNRRVYEQAECVMTLGELMAQRLARQFDPAQTPRGRIEVIYPWVDTDMIRPLRKEENWFANKYDLVDKTTVMYSGNMGLGHDIETILQAAVCMRDKSNIHFMFIGSGPKWKLVEQTKKAEGLHNVTLLSWQPEAVLPFSLATADLAAVSLEEGIEGIAIPSKAFSFFGAGAALLLISRPNSELARIVQEHRCGWTVSPGRPDEFVRVLASLEQCSDGLQVLKRNSRLVAERIGARTNSLRIVDLLRASASNS